MSRVKDEYFQLIQEEYHPRPRRIKVSDMPTVEDILNDPDSSEWLKEALALAVAKNMSKNF